MKKRHTGEWVDNVFYSDALAERFLKVIEKTGGPIATSFDGVWDEKQPPPYIDTLPSDTTRDE